MGCFEGSWKVEEAAEETQAEVETRTRWDGSVDGCGQGKAVECFLIMGHRLVEKSCSGY